MNPEEYKPPLTRLRARTPKRKRSALRPPPSPTPSMREQRPYKGKKVSLSTPIRRPPPLSDDDGSDTEVEDSDANTTLPYAAPSLLPGSTGEHIKPPVLKKAYTTYAEPRRFQDRKPSCATVLFGLIPWIAIISGAVPLLIHANKEYNLVLDPTQVVLDDASSSSELKLIFGCCLVLFVANFLWMRQDPSRMGLRRDSWHDLQRQVDAQAEATRKKGTWQALVLNCNRAGILQLIKENPAVLEERGPVGETMCHLLLLFNTPEHTAMAKELITKFPRLIYDRYEKEPYSGENLLHIAIVNKNIEMVEWLTDRCPELMNHAATGNFFSKGQACYYGEFPLGFAVCTNQKNLVEYFLEKHDAALDTVDSNGNTVLHLCVIHRLSQMYEFLEEEGKKKRLHLAQVLNEEDLTTLNLAANIGDKEMFEFIFERRRQLQWTYGPISSFIYPLDEIDWERGKQMGAIEWIVDNGHTHMLTAARIKHLIDVKWQCFAGKIFFQRFMTAIIALCLFTFLIMSKPESVPGQWFRSVYLAVESLLLAGSVYKLLIEVREMVDEGVRVYFSPRAIIENVCSLGSCCAYVGMYGTRRLELADQHFWTGLVAMFAWCYMLWFLLGFRLTGPFVVMIYKMVIGDVLPFSIVMTIFLLGFSQAFYVTFEPSGDPNAYLKHLHYCFSAMIGNLDMSNVAGAKSKAAATFLAVVFVVICILLINLLIAMMGNTYNKVNEEADQEWVLQRAGIIFSIEQNMTDEELEENKYWIVVLGKRYLQVEEENPNHFHKFIA